MSHPTIANGLPGAQGLYDPRNEHDACGIGFVANIKGHKSHEIILKGIQVLINLTHRGACGCDPETGDGAGVTIQVPHKFFVRECAKLGFTLPGEGEYGVGMTFLPVERHQRLQCEGILERIVQEEGLKVLAAVDLDNGTEEVVGWMKNFRKAFTDFLATPAAPAAPAPEPAK